MRIGTILLAVIAVVGCATWRPASAVAIQPDAPDAKRILAVLKSGRALEIEVKRADATALSGELLRAWTLPTTPVADADQRNDSEDSPTELARRRGWVPETVRDGEIVDLSVAEIVSMRAYEPDTGRTILALAGCILLVALVAIGGILLTTKPPYN
jgi:hypothetical protein